MSEETPQNSDLEGLQETVIVEVKPGVAAVFSQKPVPGLELLSFDLMPEGSAKVIADGLSGFVAGANILAQKQVSPEFLQGLVRLNPTTVEKLQTMVPVVAKTGENLGVLKTAGGNGFSHIMRWSELAPADLARLSALSTGPGMVLVALQMQLSSISRRLDENLKLTRQAINEIRQATQEERWSTLISLDSSVSKAVEEARQIGQVSTGIFSPILSKETDILKSRNLFKQNISKHLKGLECAESKSERKEYVLEHQNDILNDAYGYLLAEWTRHRWNVLRASHISLNPDDEKLLQAVLTTTESEYEEAQQELQKLVGKLIQQLKLMTIIEGKSVLRLPLGLGRKYESDNPLEKSEQLAQSVAELMGSIYQQPSKPAPALLVFDKDETGDDLLSILQWSLPREEKLLVLADVNVGMRNSYLGITQNYFFVTRYADLKKNGDTGTLYNLQDVRYVRFDDDKKNSPTIHIHTKDASFSIGFDSWISQDKNLKKVARVADIFASVMNIPEAEKKQDPVFEIEMTELKAIKE
ncbi:hypothetical protein [Rothia sp. P5766]|uniref:hypothetical protein n=1 Tax=Rothia sp. P5766 TaxID=3402656 RepID=UPI003AE0CE8B